MSERAEARPTLGGLVLATMFRGDPAQLMQWCNYHLNQGAERLYVVLDRPDANVVNLLPESPRVRWEVIDDSVWDAFYAPSSGNVERRQVDAVRWLARVAQSEGHEYLAFVDTDELLDFDVPFAEIAARYPNASALTMPVREMWFEVGGRTSEPFGATLALRWAPSSIEWNRTFGWRAQYFRNGVLGHDAGKTVYRLPLASGTFSVHGPLSGRLRAQATSLPDALGRLLHFDSGSLATWNAKWVARLAGTTVAAGLGPHRRAQQRLFATELRRDPADQERFFETFYTLAPDVVTELESDGRVLRVDVGALLDGPLPVPPPAGSGTLTRLPTTSERVDLQFALVCDQNFVRPTLATMISVLSRIDPAKSVRFVILGDGLGAADEQRFRELEHTAYQVEVQVHDVTADLDRDIGVMTHWRSRATYGRVYLVDLLPEQRTVYLDGDVLATRDISELFDLDLGGACIAGVPDSGALRLVADPAGVPIEQRMRLLGIAGKDPLEYLNAGVLVLDLDNPDYRELALCSRGHVAGHGRALAQHDQDAINMAFAGRKHRLPSTYNYMTQFYTSERAAAADLVDLKYSAADASLIHFSGKIKPWLAAEDEFYNGLYRRLVLTAEEQVGVSCGFYFSRPRPGRRDWSAQRWQESLGRAPAPAAPVILPGIGDVELVDITDTAVYLRLTSEAYEHARAVGLRVVARTPGHELFEVPISRFSAQQTHLNTRIVSGIRTAALDLVAALAGSGGLARHVELFLTPGDGAAGFERSLGMIDVLAAGTAATPALLGELGVDGSIRKLEEGVLRGWYRSPGEDPVTLHIGGELVSRGMPPAREDGTRPIRFRAAHLVELGYGASGGELSVRVAGTNVPLPGLRLDAAAVRADTARREAGPSLVDKVRRRLSAARNRIRARARRQLVRLRGPARKQT
jgi:lipopolysaccharide biosynthesis glycosyltransferase